jgi:pullulanase
MIISAKIQGLNRIEVNLQPPEKLKKKAFSIDPEVRIISCRQEKDRVVLKTEPLIISQSYRLRVDGVGEKSIEPDGVLDLLYTEKPLGYSFEGRHVFRMFAPRAIWVKLVLFRNIDDAGDTQVDMIRDEHGLWEITLDQLDPYLYYGYRVHGAAAQSENFDASLVLADPYSRAVLTRNHFLHPARTLLYPPDDFDWADDTWIPVPRDELIIYEMHVRDMTMHLSSHSRDAWRGTYLGLTDRDSESFAHLKRLGVNCVELMPVQEFGNIEVDYKNRKSVVYNDWNAYERNHWGYMTSFYFAPESYYATGASMTPGEYTGADGRAVTELKTLVKTFHENGIAVIMDVVYNHVSQYDLNPLKYIDKKYYFRLDEAQNYLSESGCGNDLKTERPMARKLIIDSLLYWMRSYHIDGFRFDLAPLIDQETLVAVTGTLREVNPDVILIAEPWGGGRYDLRRFSQLGWSAWNDQFRNGIKGQNPVNGLGVLFGSFFGGQNSGHIQNFISGSVQSGGGPFISSEHAVNYFESHDDYSLGDFIRIGLREVDPGQPVRNLDRHARLTDGQLKLNKLAALFLFTSQGMVMVHAGQEFGRSKVIAKSRKPDTYSGFIDHNSYNKDDETNWINYDDLHKNEELVQYYAGLISLRKRYPSFRRMKGSGPVFLESPDPLFFRFRLSEPNDDFLVLLNCHPGLTFSSALDPGTWDVLADAEQAGVEPVRPVSNQISIGPRTGMILKLQTQNMIP